MNAAQRGCSGRCRAAHPFREVWCGLWRGRWRRRTLQSRFCVYIKAAQLCATRQPRHWCNFSVGAGRSACLLLRGGAGAMPQAHTALRSGCKQAQLLPQCPLPAWHVLVQAHPACNAATGACLQSETRGELARRWCTHSLGITGTALFARSMAVAVSKYTCLVAVCASAAVQSTLLSPRQRRSACQGTYQQSVLLRTSTVNDEITVIVEIKKN